MFYSCKKCQRNFDNHCIESVDNFGHFYNIFQYMSMEYLSFICVFFDSFHHGHIVFSVKVFHFLGQIYRYNLFVMHCKWNCFLNFSDTSLLVCRNAAYLHINLYPTILLNSGCLHQCPQGIVNSPKWLPLCKISRGV